MSNFTKEQLQELEVLYGLKRNDEVVEVRDGFVSKSDKVWWRSEVGPELIQAAATHWSNIVHYPHYYQVKRPIFKAEYIG